MATTRHRRDDSPGPPVSDGAGGPAAPDWYRLDNAARVFAAIATRRNTTVFRVAATLRAPVDRATLQAATDALLPRFPALRARLRAGLFWHHLEAIDGAPAVRRERRAPCRRFTRREDGPWQLRILVHDRRIAVEVSHVLTDGGGALALLRALVTEYLVHRGLPRPVASDVPRPDEPPPPEESEDAYRRFYAPDIPPPPIGPRALRLHAARLPADDCRVVEGIVPAAPVRALARTHGTTLTEFLVTTLLAALLDLPEVRDRGRRPCVVMTPVDLRRIFGSRTLRNFFLSTFPSADPRLGAWTLEEIAHDVHHAVQGAIGPKRIARQIRRNVGAERHPLVRMIPLVLKIPAKRLLYARRWGTRATTALSNLGRVELPPEVAAEVERIDAVPNPSSAHGTGCAVTGFGDRLFITFASITEPTGLERAFFTRLRRAGVPVRIETNRPPPVEQDHPAPEEA